MLIIYTFLFLISFFGLNFLLNKKANISFALTPFLTIVCILITLYLLGIFGLLLGGAWFLYCIGFGSFFYYTYSKIKEKNITIKYFLQCSFYPLYFFAFLFFINLFLYKDFHIIGYDSMAHWGVFTKILTTYHDFIDQYIMINKADYPRMSSLLHYYIISFLNKGVFNEGIVIFSQTLFFISASCFFIFHKKQKFIFYILIFVGFYPLFGLIKYISISSIYNDATLALFWALSIILYLCNTKNKIWIVGGVLFCLPQIKEIGLLYCCFTLLIITINELFFNKIKFLTKLKIIGFLIGIVILSKLTWFIYIQYKGVEVNSFEIGKNRIVHSQEDINKFKDNYYNSITSFSLIDNYNNTTPFCICFKLRYRKLAEVLRFFSKKDSNLYHILHKEKNLIIGPLYFIILIVCYLLILYFYRFNYIEKSIFYHGKKQYLYFCFSLVIILISYFFIQIFLYLNTSFTRWEIVHLISFRRYLGTLIIGGLLIIIFLLTLIEKKRLLLLHILILFPLFTFNTKIIKKIIGYIYIVPESYEIINNKNIETSNSTVNLLDVAPSLNILYTSNGTNTNSEIKKMMNAVKKIDKKAIVYIYNNGGTGHQKKEYLYYGFPLRILDAPFELTTVITKENIQSHNLWERAILSPDVFKNYLNKCDYLLLRNDDSCFWEQYGKVVKEAKLKGVFISRMP